MILKKWIILDNEKFVVNTAKDKRVEKNIYVHIRKNKEPFYYKVENGEIIELKLVDV